MKPICNLQPQSTKQLCCIFTVILYLHSNWNSLKWYPKSHTRPIILAQLACQQHSQIVDHFEYWHYQAYSGPGWSNLAGRKSLSRLAARYPHIGRMAVPNDRQLDAVNVIGFHCLFWNAYSSSLSTLSGRNSFSDKIGNCNWNPCTPNTYPARVLPYPGSSLSLSSGGKTVKISPWE